VLGIVIPGVAGRPYFNFPGAYGPYGPAISPETHKKIVFCFVFYILLGVTFSCFDYLLAHRHAVQVRGLLDALVDRRAIEAADPDALLRLDHIATVVGDVGLARVLPGEEGQVDLLRGLLGRHDDLLGLHGRGGGRGLDLRELCLGRGGLCLRRSGLCGLGLARATSLLLGLVCDRRILLCRADRAGRALLCQAVAVGLGLGRRGRVVLALEEGRALHAAQSVARGLAVVLTTVVDVVRDLLALGVRDSLGARAVPELAVDVRPLGPAVGLHVRNGVGDERHPGVRRLGLLRLCRVRGLLCLGLLGLLGLGRDRRRGDVAEAEGLAHGRELLCHALLEGLELIDHALVDRHP